MPYEVDLLDKVAYAAEISSVEAFPAYAAAILETAGVLDEGVYQRDMGVFSGAGGGSSSGSFTPTASVSDLGIGGDDDREVEDGFAYLTDLSLWKRPEVRSFTGRKTALGIGWQRSGASAKPSRVADIQKAEVKDPKHRMGFLVQFIFDDIYAKKVGGAKMNAQYFEWLNSLNYFEVVRILRDDCKLDEKVVRKMAPAFLKGVTYLDKATRPNFRVKVDSSGLLTYRGAPLDTASMGTMFSGRGWGIWVMTPRKRFYTASHVKGLFHHSSFMAGGKVICGGEWKVTKGRIDYITGKTGHYMTDLEALAASLKQLVVKGADLSATQVGLYRGSEARGTLVPAYEVLSRPEVRTGMQSWGSRPLLKGQNQQRAAPSMTMGTRG